MNVPCGFGQHDRFWAQFDTIAERMIAAHDKPETDPDGRVMAPERNRKEFELSMAL